MSNRISETVRNVRKRADIKQDALARLVGCSSSYITKIERETAIPSAVMAVKLELALRLKKGLLVEHALAFKLKKGPVVLPVTAKRRHE